VDWCVINSFKVWAQNSPIFSEFRLKMLTRILDRVDGGLNSADALQCTRPSPAAAGSCLILFPACRLREEVVIFATGCFCLECLEGRFRGGMRVPGGDIDVHSSRQFAATCLVGGLPWAMPSRRSQPLALPACAFR
jgi:hypothetical protein